jgi:hypothetical protein
MAKNIEAFGGFDELAGMLTRIEKDPEDVTMKDKPANVKLSKSIENENIEDVDDDVEVEEDKHQVKDTLSDEDKEEETDETSGEDEETEDEDKGESSTKSEGNGTSEGTTDLGEVEPEISSYFAEQLISKLGVELNDKDAKFEKLDDVIDLMSQVIEANSVPTYANDEVAEYDKYVRDGGNLKSFYDQVYKDTIDPEKIDLENEKDQKLAIEANLKNLGYKEDRIKKTIGRYEDAEVLKDEATDAIESIKEFQSKKAKTLLATQEKERIETEKRNQEFVDNVVKYVNTLKDIRGIEVDSKTKKEIIDHIFRVTPDGMTQFQKSYASDVAKNLVESAYFNKYGDIILSKTSKKATDAALNKVRDKLKASKGKRNTGSGSGQGLGKASPNFSTLSSLIIK